MIGASMARRFINMVVLALIAIQVPFACSAGLRPLVCQQVQESVSPDNAHIATVRACAFSLDSLVVEEVLLGTNPQILDFGHDRTVAAYMGAIGDVSINWHDDTTL